jgi:hypothetical protein
MRIRRLLESRVILRFDPVATYRARRHAECRRSVLFAQTPEETALHHSREPLVDSDQSGERIVQRQEKLRVLVGRRE